MEMIHLTPLRRRTDPSGGNGAGLAVRREWPGGDHDIVHFGLSLDEMNRFIGRDVNYWQRGPIRPTRHAVVEISAHDFDLHRDRRPCYAPDCPAELDAAAAARWTRP